MQAVKVELRRGCGRRARQDLGRGSCTRGSGRVPNPRKSHNRVATLRWLGWSCSWLVPERNSEVGKSNVSAPSGLT
jgi:hypothetical protein